MTRKEDEVEKNKTYNNFFFQTNGNGKTFTVENFAAATVVVCVVVKQ